jgi:hypothetical protein
MKKIPGHAKAYTLWLLLILTIGVFAATGSWLKAMWTIFLVLGIFLADQAVHLAQEDHSAPPATAIEKFMQSQKIICIILGTAIALVSLLLLAN